MASKKPRGDKAEPMIRFGGEWIPAHDLWDKMETANVVADALERFNERFPQLSSSGTRDVVPLVRQRLKDIDLRMPDDDQPQDLTAVAIGLLESMVPEEVVKVLRQDHNVEMDIAQLVQLAGEDAYSSALRREAGVFAHNQVSPEQTAELWNDAARPAPGGGLWTAKKVGDLLEAQS
jgi:hypothetical protein